MQAACCAAVVALGLPAHASEDEHILVLGRISDDPAAHFNQLKPLLDYVVPRMRDVGITEGRILMARDAQQMASYLRRGRVDWINETAGNAAELERRGVAESFLITERDGATRYHSLFFVRSDSPVRTLADLLGRSVAFQSPLSTSAYFLPASSLLAEGLALEPLLSPMDKPDADAVGYVFARTELNVSTWVHKGLVDAGVLSNLDWRNPGRLPPAFARDFRVIARTDDVPRALILSRTSLEPKVQARLREVLIEAAEDPDAGEILRRFISTSRFLPISEQDRASLNRLGDAVKRVRSEVE